MSITKKKRFSNEIRPQSALIDLKLQEVWVANPQFSCCHIIVDWQKQYKIRGFMDVVI